MTNLSEMMKQAQNLQNRMQELQSRLALVEITGKAGAGMVEVTLNGKGEMRGLKLDPSLLAPGEQHIVEDLVVAAHNDAKSRVEEHMKGEMSKLTGGLSLPPGLSLPF